MTISCIRTLPTLKNEEKVEFVYLPKTGLLAATLLGPNRLRRDIPLETLPRNLKVIKSPLEFHVLLNQSYVKVSRLSDGDILIDLVKNGYGGADSVVSITDLERLPEQVMSLVRSGMETLQSSLIKDEVVLILGRTSSGKSILGNLLAGCVLYGKKAGLEMGMAVQDPIFPVSDSNVESCTGCPGLFTTESRPYTLIDYPGFEDTKPVRDIVNAFFRKAVLNDVKRLKLVLVVSYDSIKQGSRSMVLKETFEDLFQFMGFSDTSEVDKIEMLANGIVLIISKTPPLENSAVRHEIEQDLRNFLNEKSSLSLNEKKLLDNILESNRWGVFSGPSADGTCPKTIPEKTSIERLIDAAKTVRKDDIHIQAKVNRKIRGEIQTYLQAFIRSIKAKIVGNITTEINNFFVTLLSKFMQETVLREFQKNYVAAIESKNQTTLSEFLMSLKFSPELFANELVNQVKSLDETISFFRELLPDQTIIEIPHKRNWISYLDLTSFLTSWNKQLTGLLADATVNANDTTLVLEGGFVKLNQVKVNLSKAKDLKNVIVHALHTFTLDEDLDGEKMRGVNVTIIAPRWVVVRNRLINLKGKDAAILIPDRAADGREDRDDDRKAGANGNHGENGKPGLPGDPGGHFFGLGGEFENIEGLTINVEGGNGSSGQKGGNGRNGILGDNGIVKQDLGGEEVERLLCKSAFEGHCTATLKERTGWDFFETPVKHDHRKAFSWCINYGKDGGRGGDAGKGGAAGLGGPAGLFSFLMKSEDLNKIKSKVANGQNGAAGTPGKAGLGVEHGLNSKGLVSFLNKSSSNMSMSSYDWKWENVPKQEIKEGKGTDGTVPSELNEEGRTCTTLESFDLLAHLYSYREYTMRASNPLTKGWIEAFRQRYDSYPGIIEKASAQAFYEECNRMEDFYRRLEEKLICAPLYHWMTERLQAFKAPDNRTDLALLQSLQTYTTSKILQFRSMTDSRLIIDISGFLNSLQENLNRLNKCDHNVAVRIYKDNYLQELRKKIDEADFYIKKLAVDIRAADQELVIEIKKLMEEIKSYQKSNAYKLDELEVKKAELEQYIRMRKSMAGMTLMVQIIGCCIPGYGPIIAAIGSMIFALAANSQKAPEVAPELLAAFIELSNEAENDPKKNLEGAPDAELVRVRIGAIAKAVVELTDKSEKSEEKLLEALNQAVERIHKEQDALEKFKEGFKNRLEASLKDVVIDAIKLQNDLQKRSKVALDFSRISIKRIFDDIAVKLSVAMKPFAAKEGLLNIMRQLKEALDTSINIYDKVQDYQERQRLVDYMGQLANPTVQDPRIEAYKQKILQNMILDQYTRAVAAVRQWAFPYANQFLGDFVSLKQFLESSSVEAFLQLVKDHLQLLRNKVDADQNEISGENDAKLWRGKFSSVEPNGPFFIWNYKSSKQEIIDFFQGKSVAFFADLRQQSKKRSVVKFREIQIQLYSKDKFLQRKLNEALFGKRIEMRHSGLSYFEYQGQFFHFSNDQGFSLQYLVKDQNKAPEEVNDVVGKMNRGDFMLSPYTLWMIRLMEESELYSQFKNSLANIEIHLVGRGRYLYTEMAQAQQLDLAPNANPIIFDQQHDDFVRRSASAFSPSGPSKAHPPVEGDNAFAQRNNNGYLYQATDIELIVKSPTIVREFQNIRLISCMQGADFQNAVEEILVNLRIDRPVLCCFNIANTHWVVFCIVKVADNQVVTLYKDSYGNGNNTLNTILRERSQQFKIHPGTEQMGNGTLCGIFALQNGRIMVRELSGPNRQTFIDNFETVRFCTLDEARILRNDEFARLYVEGEQEDARQRVLDDARKRDLERDHHGEIERIIQLFQQDNQLNGIVVQNQKIGKEARRTIVVEIAAANSDATDYIYRIEGTKDLELNIVKGLILRSYGWTEENGDYRVENGIIKVSRKLN